ncbi:MAG: hypothetical protein M0T81_10540 [Thermoplasmatales archaeon]|jgi:hypothetical protein|nr:hypothetical protein [Thermoplasmatales archaeon]
MSHDLGMKIPGKIMKVLGEKNSNRENSVIFLLSQNDSGYPHVALLSPFQVLCLNQTRLLVMINSFSGTTQNISMNGKGTLIIQSLPGVEYLKCKFERYVAANSHIDIESESLFLAETVSVLEDFSEKAPLISELLFNAESVEEKYSGNFLRMLRLAREDKLF